MRRIVEIFDSPAEWTREWEEKEFAVYEFQVESPKDWKPLKYVARFDTPRIKDYSELVMYTDGEEIFPEEEFDFPVKVSLFAFRQKETTSGHGVTGSGMQFTVFSTVAKIVEDFWRRNPDVDWMWFSGKESSRVKLYRTFAQLMERDLRDITFHGEYVSRQSGSVFLFQRG